MPVLPSLTRRRRKLLSARPLRWPALNLAHRGAAGEAPENTMAAFQLAARQGADGIEFDVHLSADSIPVVIHDARLERTTSGSGLVAKHTSAELRRLDAGAWFGGAFACRGRSALRRRKVPRLSEVLRWVGKRQLRAFLEIKVGARGKAYPGIEAKVLEEIKRAGVTQLTTVISFDFETLRRLRRLDSGLALGIDCTRPLLALRRGEQIGAHYLLPHWAFATRRFIRRAHQEGFQVIVWDLDQPLWMRRKILDGVDGIITRYPARLKAILDGLKNVRGDDLVSASPTASVG